jgi:5'-nucleotidase
MIVNYGYEYEDFVEKAKKLVSYFNEEKCDLIIALTHMRTNNDILLGTSVPEIDLILGGHDHIYYHHVNNNNIVLKSGSDFHEITLNKLKIISKNDISQSELKKHEKKFGPLNVSIKEICDTEGNHINVLINKEKAFIEIETKMYEIRSNLPESYKVKEIVNNYQKLVEEKFKKEIFHLHRSINAKFSFVRSQNTELGNFLSDLMRFYLACDCVILNSGSIRIDSTIGEGSLTYGILKRISPNEAFIIRVKATGEQILKSLENGVSKYPNFEGRFPCISNIIFEFNPQSPPMTRIIKYFFYKIKEEVLGLTISP